MIFRGRAVLLVAVLALAGCTTPWPQWHELPSLPQAGRVKLPGKFELYAQGEYPHNPASHPIPRDSVVFASGLSSFGGLGPQRCLAQIVISPADPQITTPQAHLEKLNGAGCDSAWSNSGGYTWLPDPADPRRWTVERDYMEPGWFSNSYYSAVGVIRFVPERGLVLGLWAADKVYSRDEAITVLDEVLASIG